MVSAIDPSLPFDGVPAVKEDLRNNLQAAKDEIEALQARFQGEASPFDFIPASQHAAILARTSTDDHTAELQAWMDVCKNEKVKGVWGAGVYNISAPLFVTRNNFETNCIIGAGRGAENPLSQTTLRASHVDGPAIAIQYARGVYLGHLYITGQNTQAVGKVGPTDIVSDYVSPGVRNTQFSPHAGVAIDPAVGPVPADGGYPGMTYEGNVGGSQEVTLDHVCLDSFAVGCVVSPDGTSTQGDGIRALNCRVRHCDYAYSICQSQTRECMIHGGGIIRCRVGVTSTTHGNQSGTPFSLSNIQINAVYRVFEIGDTRDVWCMDSVYGEAVKEIGRHGVGLSSSKMPMVATGCYFNIDDTLEGIKASPITLESHGPSTWIGCHIRQIHKKAINITGTVEPSFIGGSFLGRWPDNELGSVGNNLGAASASMTKTLYSSVIDSPYKMRDKVTTRPTTLPLSATSINIAAGTISFDTTEAANLAVDQLIFWRMLTQSISATQPTVPALEITSIVGNTVTCDKLFDDQYYDTTTWHGGTLNALTNPVAPESAKDINVQGASYALTLEDIEAEAEVHVTSAAAASVAVPASPAVAFPTGGTATVRQLGTGTVTIQADPGVTLNGVVGGAATILAQYGSVDIVNVGFNSWAMSGQHATVT